MTVAAVILAPSPDAALHKIEGRAAVRRLVELAWAGGAVPIVVMAPERDGTVADALAGSPAILAAPPAEVEPSLRAVDRALAIAHHEVSETSGALILPVEMVWVDAETITSLIEAHGLDHRTVLQAAWDGRPGWPILVSDDAWIAIEEPSLDAPLDLLAAVIADHGLTIRALELGDPGIVLDRTTPRNGLPAYGGPPEPVGGPPPEWGAAAADRSDDDPLDGPALAPDPPADPDTI